MSDSFEDSLKELAMHSILLNKVTTKTSTYVNGFVGVGVTVDPKALNDMLGNMAYGVLKKKYDLLKRFAQYLAWLSPVYTGYFVENWRIGLDGQNKPYSAKAEGIGIWYASGSMRRKMKLDAGAAEAARNNAGERLVERLQAAMLAAGGQKKLRETWSFYNPTPYAQAVESKHGVIEGAATAVGV